MFLLLPIRTDSPIRRRPIVNYAFLLINIFLYVYIYYGVSEERTQILLDAWVLNGLQPRLYQFITYAFLHHDLAHLIGNMLFLYIFGNNLNDKLGHIPYFIFYMAAAIFTGAGYALISPASLLGASGAIAAVTTGFLVLFPRSNILVVIWIFYFIETFEFPSLFLIGFKMILMDNILLPAVTRSGSNVAYGAHLIGYLFGFVVPLFLLAVRALDRDQFDILALWSRVFRRRQFAQASARGPVFERGVATSRPLEATVLDHFKAAHEVPAPVAELKNAIGDSLGRFDLPTAAAQYRKLMAMDKTEILSCKQQLDVANQLMSEQDYPTAADAYEKYLRCYPDAPQIEQIQLLLGIIYGRYLSTADRARELLQKAKGQLTDRNQINLCDEELRRLG